VGLDFDFGLGFGCFNFVDYGHFHEGIFRMRGHEWAYHVDNVRIHNYYTHSVVRNDFRRDDHGRFVNDGIGRDRIQQLTHVEHASFVERNPVGDRNRLAVQNAGDFHKQPMAGPAGAGHTESFNAGHTESFNAGGQQNFKGPEGNNSFHPQTFNEQRTTAASSVSKVYRPPTGGPGVGHGSGPGAGYGQGSGSGHGPNPGGSPQKQKN
jgi:hypothetical protein